MAAVTRRGILENDRCLEGCKGAIIGTVRGRRLLSPGFSSPQCVLRLEREDKVPGTCSVDLGFTLNLLWGRIQS